MRDSLIHWLREACSRYRVEPVAVYRPSPSRAWPLIAADESALQSELQDGGHFLPLPKEPAALANVLEVSVVNFILENLQSVEGTTAARGTERGYPDIEISGEAFGSERHAVDIKVARRNSSRTGTQSRISLYTGNTYFRYPQLHWPGTFRPFREYKSHLDIVVLYTFDEDLLSRARDVELLVHPAWRIGSKQRSSTTREYIGAVMSIEDLRKGQGEFDTEEAFYSHWQKHPFKIGRAVQLQLDRLLAKQDANR